MSTKCQYRPDISTGVYHSDENFPRQAIHAVRDQLVAGYRIELRRYRMLGLLPAQRIVLRDRFERDRVVGAVDAALGDGWPVGDRTAALVAVAAAARMRTVLPRARRRAHRDRIAELTSRSAPVPNVLRTVLRDIRAAGARG